MSGLILTRRPSETVEIGADIIVTVLGIKGNQVSLHFDVPRHIPVHRSEIAARIRKEQEALCD